MTRPLLLGLGLLLLAGRAEGRPEAPRWLSDLDAARKLSARTGKPLFVVFRCEH
jgi:hypothetical protein